MTHDELREAVARIVAQGKCKYMPEYTAEEWEEWRRIADRIMALGIGGGLREALIRRLTESARGPGEPYIMLTSAIEAVKAFAPRSSGEPVEGPLRIRLFREDDQWIAEVEGQSIASQGGDEWKALDELGRLIVAYKVLTRRPETPLASPQKPPLGSTAATPNALTRKVMEETEAGVNVVDFGSVKELIDDLDSEPQKGDAP